MGKKRVYELAKELNVASKDLITKANEAGYDVKNHMSTLDDAQVSHLSQSFKQGAPKTTKKEVEQKTTTNQKPESNQSAAKPVANKPAPTKQPSQTAKPATETTAKKPAENTGNQQQGGKTKIKVTAIRRNRPAESSTTNTHSPRPTHEGQQRAQHSSANNNGNNRPNHTNNTHSNSSNNNHSNNSNNNSNQAPRGQRQGGNQPSSQARPTQGQRGNSSQSQGQRNNNFRNNNQRPSAPAPRSGNAGLRHLEQYKEQAAQTQVDIQQQRDHDRKRRQEKRRQEQKPVEKKVEASSTKPTSSTRAPQHKPADSRVNTPTSRVNMPKSTPTTRPQDTTKKTTESHKDEHRKRNFGPDATPYRAGAYKKNNSRRKQKGQQRHQIKKEMPKRKDRPLPELLVYSEGMNAQDLGKLLHREPAEIVKKLFMLGVMVNQNQSLDNDTIELIATDYGIESQQKVEEDVSDIDTIFNDENANKDTLASRPPVVTIMGHVDHGKTTLLDRLRHTHVTAGEAGGITQHIGAYQVKLNDRVITFLDTPGHAAFTNMRARGADVTDIIVLVVAADDGVMPQTIEAINHAKAANAPIIVAVNKIDKPGANPNHVMEQLTEYGLIPESWGGDTIFVEISAKMGTNIDELLEMILLEADVLELKANPDQKGVGTVLEARLDKGKGPVASLLVQQGTLRTGDPIVVGNTFGRVRVMTNDRGRRVKEAFPSEPVEITGLNDVPDSADHFAAFEDEKTARAAGEERAKRAQLIERNKSHRVTLDNLFETMKEGELKEVDVIIKADVQGSAEALAGSLQKIEVEGVRVNIIHQAVGAINESDVTLASASNAIIIGFNVRPTPQAKSQADSDDVDIRLHNVIYRAIDEIESAMKGMLEPTYEEKVIGDLTVRELYKVTKLGTIAGCLVNTGSIQRDSGVRLIRQGIVIYDGKLSSLKRFKDDVKEVRAGFECGLMIENYNDIKVDDEIEAYVMQEVPVQ
ncbi:translation initiation factor IF-2 [Lapidilactobacillus mulanensis]|uniref:Translation initiation factor IF-2 n=1 Tax=Lapidilactobacillus mulanensis TaxID=2485999 RepID=A0ABW4DQ14_9LACO|nr:translation initiation factor IF-2 [Lapidilactobacillus mulanensis]